LASLLLVRLPSPFGLRCPISHCRHSLREMSVLTFTPWGFKSPDLFTTKKPTLTCRLFRWCAWRDLNPHGLPLEPKSSVSANSTTGAHHMIVLGSLSFGLGCILHTLHFIAKCTSHILQNFTSKVKSPDKNKKDIGWHCTTKSGVNRINHYSCCVSILRKVQY
jgi:hypothetical protein